MVGGSLSAIRNDFRKATGTSPGSTCTVPAMTYYEASEAMERESNYNG